MRRDKIDAQAGRLAWMSAAIAIPAGFPPSPLEVRHINGEPLPENESRNETEPDAPDAENKHTERPETEADSAEGLTLDSLQRQIDTLIKKSMNKSSISQMKQTRQTAPSERGFPFMVSWSSSQFLTIARRCDWTTQTQLLSKKLLREWLKGGDAPSMFCLYSY